MTAVKTEGRADLLKKFEYITDMKEHIESELMSKYHENMWGIHDGVPDDIFKILHMESMEKYPHLFVDRETNCFKCETPIILPIDLRRMHGGSYHGYCFEKHIKEEIKKGWNHNVHELEHFLKIIRTCEPSYDGEKWPLREFQIADLTTRRELEHYYF